MGIEGYWDMGLILLLCILTKLTRKKDKKEVKVVDGHSQDILTSQISLHHYPRVVLMVAAAINYSGSLGEPVCQLCLPRSSWEPGIISSL